MANTIASRVYRDKYRSDMLTSYLSNALVAEKICQVDKSDNKRIQSPYQSQATVTAQALAGTYTVADFTTTDEALDVTAEFIVAEHVKDFESLLSNFDLFSDRAREHAIRIGEKIDRYVVNNLCEDATGAYTTPTGGFTTASNVLAIMANLISKVSGYAEMMNGMFLVVENTDMTGIIQAQVTNGFSYADAALNNGFIGNLLGVDIYVVRTGTFADETLADKTYTNAGHRVFGIKNVATYASPRGVKFEEKPVSLKTGMEVVTVAYCGFKLWTPRTDLIVDITLA